MPKETTHLLDRAVTAGFWIAGWLLLAMSVIVLLAPRPETLAAISGSPIAEPKLAAGIVMLALMVTALWIGMASSIGWMRRPTGCEQRHEDKDERAWIYASGFFLATLLLHLAIVVWLLIQAWPI